MDCLNDFLGDVSSVIHGAPPNLPPPTSLSFSPAPPPASSSGLSDVQIQAMRVFDEYVEECKARDDDWLGDDAFRLYDLLGHDAREATFFLEMTKKGDKYVIPWAKERRREFRSLYLR
jgi:hypothetical protein